MFHLFGGGKAVGHKFFSAATTAAQRDSALPAAKPYSNKWGPPLRRRIAVVRFGWFMHTSAGGHLVFPGSQETERKWEANKKILFLCNPSPTTPGTATSGWQLRPGCYRVLTLLRWLVLANGLISRRTNEFRVWPHGRRVNVMWYSCDTIVVMQKGDRFVSVCHCNGGFRIGECVWNT